MEAENGELWSVDPFETHPPPPIQLICGSLVADNGFWFDCFEEIPTDAADKLPSPRRVEYPDHDDASLRA